jgi:hypothetical protein
MKSIIKTSALFAALLLTGNLVHAQDENTSERLIDQLKKGIAPGLRFSTEVKTLQPLSEKNNGRESSGMQLKNNTAAGVQYKPGGGARSTTPAFMRAQATTTSHQPLASEQAAPKTQPPTTAPAAPVIEQEAAAAPAKKQ